MGVYERISVAVTKIIDAMDGDEKVTPSKVASQVLATFTTDDTGDELKWLGLEQLKQFARKALSGRFDPKASGGDDEEPSLPGVFTRLQPRYPVPRQGGDEPEYKLRHLLTPLERAWNVRRLRSASVSFAKHADALEAEGLEGAVEGDAA